MDSLVFIISPPRSGSTLLQRLLASHKEVASFSEISLLLRFLGEPQDVIRYADYRESNIEIAKQDIRDVWPEFDKTYREQIAGCMEHIYTHLPKGKRIFIDKTPRYTLIAEEIYKTFPNAKFIVLWRHPLAIAASVSKTFARNLWDLDDFEIDLKRGLDRLNMFDSPNRERIFSLRYEDLVKEPSRYLKKLGVFLEIEGLETVLDKPLDQTNSWRLGDPSGIHKYKQISSDSTQSWRADYRTQFRQNWARTYFKSHRKDWLKKRGYQCPESFESEPVFKNLCLSLKEWMRVKQKSKKQIRHVSTVFKNYTISGIRAEEYPQLIDS